MKLPIPHDWNGKDWLCLQVQWPDSVEYRALLAGFLSYLGRGRAYDEKTGTITTAQEIGWEIFNRNMPMHACAGENYQPEQPNLGELPCDWCYEGVNEECGEMGCCVEALEWRNGELWNRICGKWSKVEGGGVGIPSQTDEDEDVVEPATPELESSWACAKAHAITNLTWLMAENFLDCLAEVPAASFVSELRKRTGINFSAGAAVSRVIFWSAAEVFMDVNALNDLDKTQFRCWLSDNLDGSNNDLGEEQFKLLWNSAAPAVWGRTASLDTRFMQDMITLIGLDDYRAATRATVNQIDDYDCADCHPPESVIPPSVAYDWSHYYDFMLVGDFDWLGIGSTVYQLGEGFTANVGSYGDTIAACSKAATTPLAESRLTFWRIEYGDWPISDENSGYWAKVVPDALSTDMSLYGSQFLSGTTNKLIGQGVVLEFGNVQCFENPAIGGPSSLRGLLIAGTGADPFPSDPVYTP